MHYKNLSADAQATFRAKYSNLKVLIIDEISMTGNRLLRYIHKRLEQLTGNQVDPFGGISVLAVGDMYQLAPCNDAWIFEDLGLRNDTSHLDFAPNLWKEYFTMYELTTIMRQKDDKLFAQLLNRVRVGQHTEQDCEILSTKLVALDSNDHNKQWPHVFTRNGLEIDQLSVRGYNHLILTQSVDIKYAIQAVDSISGVQDKIKRRILQDFRNLTDVNRTGNMLQTLIACTNVCYDLSVNVDVEDGLYNGAAGTLMFIDFRVSASARVSVLWVLFEDRKIGKHTRERYKHLYKSNIDHSWTPIFDTPRQVVYKKHVIMRRQFPLLPAAAKTVHKVQGSTMQKLCVHLGRWAPCHIHYVALSRVTKLEQLQILDLNAKGIKVDERVHTEMQRLRNECKLKLYYVPPNKSLASQKLIFHNIRSLRKHIQDIKCDHNFCAVDLIFLAETKVTARNFNHKTLSFNPYVLYTPSSIVGAHGSALYTRGTSVASVQFVISNQFEFVKVKMKPNMNVRFIVSFYKAPSCSLNLFYTKLIEHMSIFVGQNESFVLFGDLNLDVSVHKSHWFIRQIEQQFGCSLLQTYHTTNSTTIDVCFTNVVNSCINTVECPWSDHKALLVYV